MTILRLRLTYFVTDSKGVTDMIEVNDFSELSIRWISYKLLRSEMV